MNNLCYKLLIFFCQIPQGSTRLPHRQDRRNPRLRPAGLYTPGAPADIRVAGPVVPSLEVEGPEPPAAQFGVLFGADLNPA